MNLVLDASHLCSSATMLLAAAATLSLCTSANAGNGTTWYDAKSFTFEGRGWSDTPSFYDRLPARAENKVFGYTWQQSRDSAGMVFRFVSDSPFIAARWKLTKDLLALPHLPASGMSGIDLYVRYKGDWQWLGAYNPQQPIAKENEQVLFGGLSPEMREFSLYLPLYNGVSSVEVGVADGATIKPAPPRKRDVKPVVFYGSSILQGGCASRPGLAYPSIIGRKLDVPIINLGFSGEGKCEHETSDLLAELDPSVYVIDCLPNMGGLPVSERISYLLAALKKAHPETPVVLVEDVVRQNIYAREAGKQTAMAAEMEKVYKAQKKQWGNKLYYVKGAKLLGTDGEPTMDGLHPTDAGFLRMAEGIAPTVRKALDEHTKR